MKKIKLLFWISVISGFTVTKPNYAGYKADHYETLFGSVKKEIFIVYSRDYCYINFGGQRSVDFPIGEYKTDTDGNESFMSDDNEISLMNNYSVRVNRTKNGNNVRIIDRRGMAITFDHARAFSADAGVIEYIEHRKTEKHIPIMVGGK
jgi:hypothetical protein